MKFALVHIIGDFISPAPVLIVLALLGVCLPLGGGGRRLAKRSIIALALLTVLPVQQWAMLPLEDRFPRPSAPPHVDGIVLLGGAIETVGSGERGVPALTHAAGRITEFAALARQYPQAKLVYAGGNATFFPASPTEAAVAKTLLVSLGIAPERLVLEDASKTTYENAVNVAALVKRAPGDIWILVTSANHMPRAVGVFRKVGWSVLPWPAAYEAPLNVFAAIATPFGQHFEQLDTALHEWFGLVDYWATGKSDDIFPAP